MTERPALLDVTCPAPYAVAVLVMAGGGPDFAVRELQIHDAWVRVVMAKDRPDGPDQWIPAHRIARIEAPRPGKDDPNG